jgi:hypothetical protein
MTHRRITSTIALTLTLAAGAAPIATADPPPLARGASCGDVCSGHGYGPASVTTRIPATAASCGDVCSGHGYGPVSAPAAVLRVAAPGDGSFDWGDAGIGAGSAFVLTIIAAGGVLTATNRRRRRTHHQHVSATS